MLRPRLQMVADLIPPGGVVVDIGSDHARLAIHLVQTQCFARVYATDVAMGPLRNARAHVLRAGLGSCIALRLSDGFDAFAPGLADCWVMAGMGGTLMARLLQRAPWLCATGTVLVAQPMSHADDLRRQLLAMHFGIAEETACYDAGRAYHALRAVFVPERNAAALPIGYAHYGALPQCPLPAARVLLHQEYNRLSKRLAALEHQGLPSSAEEQNYLQEVLHAYPAIGVSGL